MLTWAEIDLNAISYNLRQIRERVASKGAGVMAIIKDNAYGHGAVEVARVAAEIPVQMFGVATVEEAIELRQAGVKLPILVLCPILPEQAGEVVKDDITQTICDMDVCKALSEAAVRHEKQAKTHVKVDTGMGRVGVCYSEAVEFVKSIVELPNFVVEGIFTHFAAADGDPDFTNLQLDRFRSVLSGLENAGIQIPIKHGANSAAILGFPESFFNMVRPGLMIYGLYPGGEYAKIPLNPPLGKGDLKRMALGKGNWEGIKIIDLKPAMSLKTRVFYLKEVPPGWTISYGRTYTTKKPTIVASLAIGYGHGYTRRLSNIGEAIIRGKKAPIIGVVCMDQCLCDVTHIPGVAVGDEAVLIGSQGDETITADEVAEKSGTISYEVLCGINARVPRFYK